MKSKNLFLIAAVIIAALTVLYLLPSRDHDHNGEDSQGEIVDKHAGCDHGDEAGHEEGVVELTPEQIDKMGIKLVPAGGGSIGNNVNLTGEIALNGDSMAHIVPRVSGVVIEVMNKLGDNVRASDVMAIIESRELADSKTNYLAALERYFIAELSFKREERLYKQKISSEQDFLNLKTIYAEAQIGLRNAEQKLRSLGFNDAYLKKLPSEPKEMLTRFQITAPFNGTVIEKHITMGEVVSDQSSVFTIADLDTVWVDLNVYQMDLSVVKKGQKVLISAGENIPPAEGKIAYIGAVVGKESRTALARVVLPNKSGVYRPGLFVTAEVHVDGSKANVMVLKDAVQNLEGKKCVFTKDDHGFEPRFITTGRADSLYVEVVSGLEPNEMYVTDGSFELKSKIVTSTLDSHAGHGH